MIIDLIWIIGWIIVAVAAYRGGLPVVLLAVGLFVSHAAALWAIRRELCCLLSKKE